LPVPVSVLASGESEESLQQTIQITVNQAVELALRVNPEVLQMRARTEEFGELVREARAEALPQVTARLSLAQNRDPGLRNSPFFARLLAGPDPIPPEALSAFKFTNYVWNVDVSQPVFTFGRIPNALSAAREERTGVDLDVQEVENRVSFDAVRAAYAFLLAHSRLSVLETENAARERQLEQVQARFDLEDATRLDLLRARVALANVRPEVLAAENEVALALASVNSTLGRSADAPIDVIAELEVQQPPPVILRPAALLELAGQLRPELRRFGIDRRVLESRMGVVRSELKPEVRANAAYGINTFAAENVSDLALRTWTVGVSVDWKLFDGFRTSSQVAALRSQRTQSEFDERTFRNQLSVELEDSYGTWQRAIEALEVMSLAVEEAREAERVAEESLKWGAATTLDVIQSTLALRQAELNQRSASHDALLALAEMKYLVGFRADAPDSVIEAPGAVAEALEESQSSVEGSQP
jgi:outer membrane protein TolC